MNKRLELVTGSFTQEHYDKQSVDNFPYVAYSVVDDLVIYTEQPLYQAVDLALPSGLKWANMNIGSKNPEDVGLYFQWGDTVGYSRKQIESGEKVFDLNHYWDTTNGGMSFNKYNINGGLTRLELTDDAAYTNMGSDWRMPTAAEVDELVSHTTLTFIDINNSQFSLEEAKSGLIARGNLKGIRFTGTNGNSIYIPSPELVIANASDMIGEFVCVWASELTEITRIASDLDIDYIGRIGRTDGDVDNGIPVRGVKF